MDKETLLQRRAAIEKKFNDFQDEIKRLQGEYRVVEELLGKLEEAKEGAEKPKRLRKVEEDAKD